MSHNIFGNRGVFSKEPAWHRLGTVFQEDVTALEAHNHMTPPTITLEPVFTKLPSLTDKAHRPTNFALANKAIIRHPVPDDPEYKTFGIVGPEYVLVDPLEFSQIWDRATNLRIESAAFLGKGDTFFLSSRLPTFAVAGVDEVQMYLLGVSNYTGGKANTLTISGVRTVCANTVVLAHRMAREHYVVDHSEGLSQRLEKWLALLSGNLNAKILQVQESFNHLAGIKIEDDELARALFAIYPDPKPIKNTPDPDLNQKREEDRMYYVRQAEKNRQSVKELYEGAGDGLGEGILAGTAWELFQSVVELENYRRTTDVQAASTDALFGYRASTMNVAFDYLLNLRS